MKDQIEMLENSLRTNIAMARSMTSIMQLSLAKRYIDNAKNDKRLLVIYRTKWLNDDTQELDMSFIHE